MIKSKRLAYDGRGNAVAKSAEELSSAISGEIYLICNFLFQILIKYLKCDIVIILCNITI